MRKKECENGTWRRKTHVPHSFSTSSDKGLIKRSVKARKARHWLHRAAVEVAVNPAREENFFILDKNYSKSRRGFKLDREIKKARIVSADQKSLLEAEPFKWWEDGLHKKAIKACFQEYLVDIADKKILLRSKVKKEPIAKDYVVRFSKKRLRKTRWQLGGIKIELGTHLVLTVDPKRYQNIVECAKGLRKEWNDLRRWLQRRRSAPYREERTQCRRALRKLRRDTCRTAELVNLEKRIEDLNRSIKEAEKLSYIEVVEFGKEHDLPHLHVLLARVFFEKEDLKALYEHRGKQRIRVTPIRNYNALGYVLKYAKKVYNDFETVRESQAYLYWVTDAKVYGMSRDHYQSIKRREVAMTAFGWFMRMQDGEEYEGYEFVSIFDSWSLDPPPPVVTDEWVAIVTTI
jgi:hypothetical protein